MEQSKCEFRIDSQNSLLNHIYKQDNIRIIEGMSNNKRCIIFCSGNSIYFPDTVDQFREKIICKNYFDGARMTSYLIEHVNRIILIRDIRKNFYVTGISEKNHSIDSVLNMLKVLTRGYEIVTAGGSAGGYMATIIGSLLNAKYVISAGGQWNLYDYENVTERYFFLRKYKDNAMFNQYYDLSSKLKTNRVPILYMYGGMNDSDINQIGHASGVDNVFPIAIKSNAHAQRVSIEPYLRLLCASVEEVINIFCANSKGLVELTRLEDQINQMLALPKELSIESVVSSEQKQKAYVKLLYNWVKQYQDMGVKRGDWTNEQIIAIWGKGQCCSLLMKELREQNIIIQCIVETQPVVATFENIPIVDIKDLPNEVNVIIVVPYYDMKRIKEKVYQYYPGMKVIGIDEYIIRGI